MHHEAFRSGKFDTRFVEKYFKPEVLSSSHEPEEEKIAAVLSNYLLQEISTSTTSNESLNSNSSKWRKNRL
jgi:propionyl-CoA carboxylase alpha chain